MIVRLVALLGLLLAVSSPVHAEELAAGISRDKIEINSRFTGTEVAIFGSVGPASGEIVPQNRARDIVVVVRSDRSSLAVVRRKEPVGPIWINRDVMTFKDVPAFYFVASSRALADIAEPGLRRQFQLGFSNLEGSTVARPSSRTALFQQAFVDSQVSAQVYAQHEGAVTFMSPTLFRTTLALPPNVPAGNLRVTVYAFLNGEVTSSNSMTLFIDKTGIERTLYELSRQEPLLYAFGLLLLAVLSGLVAAAAFGHRH
jgi:uncharacterized protein (TIGR02186 family)